MPARAHDVVVRRPAARASSRASAPHRHTPTTAIVATALLSIPLAVWICYSDNFFQYFAIAAVSAYPSLVLIGITATIIKRRRPDLYKGSTAEWRVGGIEVLPVVGVLCASSAPRRSRCCSSTTRRSACSTRRETAIYLVGDVRDRRDLVDGRAVACAATRASTSRSPTRRSRPNEARTRRTATADRQADLLRHRRARLGALLPEVPQHRRSSTTSQYLILGGDITGKTMVPIERRRAAGSASYGEHDYRDLDEQEMRRSSR